MGREVELKLEVTPSAINEIARLAWLSEVSEGPATHEKLVTVYFDMVKPKASRTAWRFASDMSVGTGSRPSKP